MNHDTGERKDAAIKPDAPAPDSPLRPGASGNPHAVQTHTPEPEKTPEHAKSHTRPASSGNEDPGAEIDDATR